MPQVDQTNLFVDFDLTKEEFKEAYTYTPLQLIGLRILRSRDALEKVMMGNIPGEYDETYIRRQEYLRGKIEATTHLLTMAEAIKQDEG